MASSLISSSSSSTIFCSQHSKTSTPRSFLTTPHATTTLLSSSSSSSSTCFGVSRIRIIKKAKAPALQSKSNGSFKRSCVTCSAASSSVLPQALLFDCDGELVDTEKNGHRISSNDTFTERELGVTWDVDLYGELLKIGGGKERMTAYFNKVGWPEKAPKSDDERKEFIAGLHKRRTELFMALIEKKLVPLQPGVAKLIDQALEKGVKVALFSTLNEKAVSAIVSNFLGPERAEKMQIYAGDVVPCKTPDSAIYLLAANTLGVDPSRYDDAWEANGVMEMNNILPDHLTCAVLITIMRKQGNSAKDAWEFFEKMNRKGVKWSLEILGALIKSFCDEGLKREALLLQLEMERRGISSNTVIYNTIMYAFGKSDQVEEAEGLFAEMKAKGIPPSAASYNILMDAYSKRMQPEIVEKLLLEMEQLGLEPNVKSYTCLISAYGRQRKMSDMAADAFLRMKKVGIQPTSHSYTALVHAYSVGGWHEKAYTAFQDMQREGLKPSIETYTALLDAFRRAGDTESLMKIWKMMSKDKIEGTRVTFNILLDGFAKQGHYVEARDVISEFGKIGLQPTVKTYNMLMNAYARGGQESKLPQLLKEIATLNLKPDSITYSTMIYAYIRVRDFKRAFFYHKQMLKSGQVPDVKSYEKLRASLDVKTAIKNRKDKSALMGIINSSMGLLKQKRKGKKDEFWKNRKKRASSHGSSQGVC